MKMIERVLKKYVESVRPPLEIRSQLDIGYRIEKQSVYITEIRPQYNDPSIYHSMDEIKMTYVKSRNVWRIYWMRADLKWHPYDPNKEVSTFEKALEIYDEDKFGCFKG